MRFKSVFIATALALITSATALAAMLRVGLELGFATAYLETRLTQALGRKVSLGQAPHVQLKAGLHIAAGKISLANADWSDDQPMLELRAAKIHIDPQTLFDAQVVIENFELDGLRVRLHKNAEGQSNIPKPINNGGREDNKAQEHPLPIVVRHIEIKDVRLSRRNDGTTTNAEFFVESLTQQESDDQELAIVGNGVFQERPWKLMIDGSKFSALRSGHDIFATLRGTLGELTLVAAFDLPDARALQNLTLSARLDGLIPAQIADLSPLLVAHEPASVELKVEDVDPGLNLELSAGLTQFDVNLGGIVDHPLSGDGLDLTGSLNATSLPRLAKALGLGETADLPIAISGRLQRDNKRLELEKASLRAGQHVVQASAILPNFPSTDGASLSLRGEGPDFSLYQRLFELPDNLVVPYTVDAEITRNGDGRREDLMADLTVGGHHLHLSAGLDNFPSYAGSDLKFEFESPSIKAIAATAKLAVPDSALTMAGIVTVTDDAVIQVKSLDVSAYELKGVLQGQLNSHPNFGNAKLRLTIAADSLAAVGQQFGLEPLGEFPLQFETDLSGDPAAIVLRAPKLSAGGLNITSRKGELRYEDQQLHSDMTLRVSLANIDQLLGSYALQLRNNEGIRGDYSFELTPQLSPTLVSLSLNNLKGPGVSGSASIEVTPDFTFDENTLIKADLAVSDPSKLLPAITGYTFPRDSLSISASTRRQGDGARIDATLSDAGTSLLSAAVILPATRSRESITVHLEGAGEDLRRLGNHTVMPAGPLPFDLSVDAELEGDVITVDMQRFALSGSQLEGIATWDKSHQSLTADIRIPKADLQPWLPQKSPAGADIEKSDPTDSRIIPDVALPLHFLNGYKVDLTVQTGTLGLADPWFTNQSLIDMAEFHLSSGNGKGLLHIDKLQGSRGSHKGDIRIVDIDTSWRAEGNIEIEGMPLGVIAAGTSFDKLPIYDIDTTLSAQGGSLRELASTLSGDFLMIGKAGTLQKMRLSVATESFVAQLFRTLLPMLATGQTGMQVECSVLTARASDGVLSLDPGFVFRSAEVDLFAQGRIDLGSETLSIGFNNRARKGLGLSAATVINPFVAITGTLAKPKLGLDIANSALNGGAAVATAGITIIAKPLFDRFFSRRNPCDAALNQWKSASNQS